MKKYQTQQEEIATIRPRCVYLNLSQADVERVTGLAGQTGMTVGELLTNFVGDLVEGTYSNGLDERAYARNWFSRCDFSYLQNTSMLSWLLSTFGPGRLIRSLPVGTRKNFMRSIRKNMRMKQLPSRMVRSSGSLKMLTDTQKIS